MAPLTSSAEFTSEAIRTRVFLIGRFLIKDPTPELVTGLLRFSVCSGFGLG